MIVREAYIFAEQKRKILYVKLAFKKLNSKCVSEWSSRLVV